VLRLFARPDGSVQAIYSQDIPLQALGEVVIRRASHVEPLPGMADVWQADLSPVAGPILPPTQGRDASLAAEVEWLTIRMREWKI
jgi:hypothetical protein